MCERVVVTPLLSHVLQPWWVPNRIGGDGGSVLAFRPDQCRRGVYTTTNMNISAGFDMVFRVGDGDVEDIRQTSPNSSKKVFFMS